MNLAAAHTASISYTFETRTGAAVRRTVEVHAATTDKLAIAIDKKIAKLADRCAYSFDVRWEVKS